jgi:hypothetical protein
MQRLGLQAITQKSAALRSTGRCTPFKISQKDENIKWRKQLILIAYKFSLK